MRIVLTFCLLPFALCGCQSTAPAPQYGEWETAPLPRADFTNHYGDIVMPYVEYERHNPKLRTP